VDSGAEPLVTRATLERTTAKVAALLPSPVARRLRAGVDTTLDELEALGALPEPLEEEAL
jgi:UDP-glucose 4-epimerase